MFPNAELAPMRTYLRMLTNTLRPLDHPLLKHHEVLFQKDHVSGFLGDVHSVIDGNPNIRCAQRRSVVDAVAQ